MPRVSQRVSNFNGGEVSSEFSGRVDQDKYRASVARLQNFIVHPEGGIHRRPGTRFVKDVMDATKKSRLIPFIFSTEQAYILEFGDFLIRVYADEVRIDAPTRIVLEEASATLDEFHLTDHGYIDGQGPIHITTTAGIPTNLAVDTNYYINTPNTIAFDDADVNTSTDVITSASNHEFVTTQGPFRLTTDGELTEPLSANLDYYIERISDTTFKLRLTPGGSAINLLTKRIGNHLLTPTGNYVRDRFKLSTTASGAPIDLGSNGTAPHTFTPNPVGVPTGYAFEIVSPYSESELYNLHFVQSADVLFIDHKDHRPIQLSRTGNTKWSLDFQNIFDGPYLAQNTETTDTVEASGTGGTNITLTLLSTTQINDGLGWLSRDIGRLIRIKKSGQDWGHCEITGVRAGSVPILIARATVRSLLGGATAEDTWRLGSWYTNNWPATLSFSDQRLWHAGEPNTPQTLHGSETGKFLEFSPSNGDDTVVDTNGLNFQIGANQVNAIIWLGVERQLFAGTPASVFVARASSLDESVTPTNITMPQVTAVGAASVQPVTVGGNLVYMTRNGQGVRAMAFAAEADVFTPIDLTLLAKHIMGRTKTVTTMAFQFDRQQVLWLTRSDGALVAITYVPEQEIFAWHNHTLGGAFSSGDPVVESVAVIPSLDGSYDQTWMTVKRTVNSVTVRHIEFMEDEWLDGVATNMRYLDSAPVAYSGVAKSTFDGLDHLNGETVQVLVEGATHPDRVVSSGSITLDASYTDVVAGLGYVSEMETLSLEPPDPEGSSTGKVARIDHVVLRFWDSLGGELGASLDNLDPIVFRDASDPMDAPPPFFTGDKKIAFSGPFQREKVVIVRQNQPLPMNLLSMNLLMSTGAR